MTIMERVVSQLRTAGFVPERCAPAEADAWDGDRGVRHDAGEEAVHAAVEAGVAQLLAQWRQQNEMLQRHFPTGESIGGASAMRNDGAEKARDRLLKVQLQLQRREEDVLHLETTMRVKAAAAAEEAARQEQRLRGTQEKLASLFATKRKITAWGDYPVFLV